MKGLFDIDGPVLQFITKIVYAAWLNILWAVCCLPVFTAGASTTALFYVTLKIAKNEEGNITKAFFHSFKENFRQSTIIWLILLAAGIILGIDGYVFYHMRFDSAVWALGTAVFIVALAAYAIILMYIFPLQARFDNTIPAMFKNALMIGMHFLLCTVLMAVIYFAMAVVIIRIFTPAVIFGEGLCALLCSYLLSNILLLCEEKTEQNKEGSNGAESESEDVLQTVSEEEDSLHGEREWGLKDVHGKAKIGYLWAYYKLPIVIAGIFLYIAGYMIYGYAMHKETALYMALINVAPKDAFTEELSTDFLAYIGANRKKEEVKLYTGLYLTEDPSSANLEYVYASNTKITASIAGGRLDIVLMDKEAFDLLSRRGYLCNIEEFLMQEDLELYEKVQSWLTENTVVLSDNSLDVQLDPSVEYTAVTEEYPMGVDLSGSELVMKEEFDGTLYMGIISNTPHRNRAVSYLRYFAGLGAS